jgi:hypothetical protein
VALQNRVTPFGKLIADPARGEMYGNRGGRIHDPATRQLTGRRWASKAWICCVLSFKGRRRAVWGEGYTELFFCDEVTALAAGHRPCFECRRRDAQSFQAAVALGLGLTLAPRAPEMDARLHPERRAIMAGRGGSAPAHELPDGAMFALGDAAFGLRGGAALPWTPRGYGRATPLPRGDVRVLTPPTTVTALRAGYAPLWHSTAPQR